MNKELKIEIFGLVQGVNFRRRISWFANLLGLKGYVKNRINGSVLIVAQGKDTALEELLSWCQKSPFPVKISGMKYEWMDSAKEYKGFKVLKDKPFWQDQAQSFLNLGKEVLHASDLKMNVPQHVVIIPDGNRRWAREQGWHPWLGHRRAVEYERVVKLFRESKSLGVKYLTFWAFSTENWERDEKEVEEIFKILRKTAKNFKQEFLKEEIRFKHMGRKDRLPRDIMEIIDDLEKSTAKFDKLFFQLCLDYNGRDDLVRAFTKMMNANIKEIDEKVISEYLDSKGIPDPDLIIRTSGEKRTSGIMAYQAAYAELYFTNVYFPDFDSEQFRRAILDYSARTRRFGGTNNKDLKNINTNVLYDPDKELKDDLEQENLALN